jgi:biotin operon repressor
MWLNGQSSESGETLFDALGVGRKAIVAITETAH